MSHFRTSRLERISIIDSDAPDNGLYDPIIQTRIFLREQGIQNYPRALIRPPAIGEGIFQLLETAISKQDLQEGEHGKTGIPMIGVVGLPWFERDASIFQD